VLSRGLCAVALTVAFAGACSRPPEAKPLELDGNLLAVNNRTSSDWSSVEIWINQHYRITVPTIAAGTRFTVGLDAFVAGFGQRFDLKRQPMTDLRLSARQPDGTPVEIRYEFEGNRLDRARKGSP
jgi:hypothetical protein